jgi:hypothetical protein
VLKLRRQKLIDKTILQSSTGQCSLLMLVALIGDTDCLQCRVLHSQARWEPYVHVQR